MSKVRTFGSKLKHFGLDAAVHYYAREKALSRYSKEPFSNATKSDIKKAKYMAMGMDCLSVWLNTEGCTEDEIRSAVESLHDQICPVTNLVVGNNSSEDITTKYLLIMSAHDLMHPLTLAYICDAISKASEKGYSPAIIYGDELSFSGEEYFKPDFAPDDLDYTNYIGRNICVRADVWSEYKRDEAVFSDEEIYEFIKYVSGIKDGYYKPEVARIVHIPAVLFKTAYRVAKDIAVHKMPVLESEPMVSIVIPSADHIEELKVCIESILEKTTYENYEILILDNNSKEDRTFKYYDSLKNNKQINVTHIESEWNYSKINNMGVKHAKGEYLLFLNNDTEVISENWIEEMLRFGIREDVGAVGAKLYYPDGTIQHGGVTLGIRGVAGHAFLGADGESGGALNRLMHPCDLSAVTAACMLVRKDIFDEINGFDEGLSVAFNDTDLCMKIRSLGYHIVWTPYATLKHFESKSRGIDEKSPEKLARFNEESWRFQKRWIHEIIAGDPYYNPNLSLEHDDFRKKAVE